MYKLYESLNLNCLYRTHEELHSQSHYINPMIKLKLVCAHIACRSTELLNGRRQLGLGIN